MVDSFVISPPPDSDASIVREEGQTIPLSHGLLREAPAVRFAWIAAEKPSVLSYDGADVPVPLRIDIQHGEADIRQVATDILGLTKLNYNACKVGDSTPVTIGFSDAVGEILVSNPTIAHPKTSFKFYI